MRDGAIRALGNLETSISCGQHVFCERPPAHVGTQNRNHTASGSSTSLVRRIASASCLSPVSAARRRCRQELQIHHPSPFLNMEILDIHLARSQISGASTPSGISAVTSYSTEALQRTASEQISQSVLENPFELRYGRRYLRSDMSYPFPCDLAELQRQSLRTLLGIQVFGGPFCNPKFKEKPPKKVLEFGCGTAFWSAMCHDHFVARGHKHIHFVGTDIAPLAPNLQRQGMNWTFFQLDMRRIPMPFKDKEFDLIVFKDLSLVMPLEARSEEILVEAIRILKPGGCIEVLETDHVIRFLASRPPSRSSKPDEQENAVRTATFPIPIGHPFAPAQNKYLQKANKWIEESLHRRRLNPSPTSRIAEMLTQGPDLKNVGYRRIAVPLGELQWERDARHTNPNSGEHESTSSIGSCNTTPIAGSGQNLTPDQLALRQTALMTVLGQIESMEPMLKEASGKNSEEWSLWWAAMMTDLLDPANGGLVGECLEMGAWWATKAGNPDELDEGAVDKSDG